MKSQYIIAAILVVVVVVAALSAFLYYYKPTEEEQVVKIGAVLPLSPPGGYLFGVDIRDALQIAIDEVNSKGGVLGRKLELHVRDNRGIAEEARAASEELAINIGVDVFMGDYHSTCALQGCEVAHEYNIPFFDISGWSNEITERGYKQVFRVCPYVLRISYIMIEAFKEYGLTDVLLLHEDTAYGEDWIKTFAPIFNEEIPDGRLRDSLYSWEASDFRPLLFEYVPDPPDIIIAAGGGVSLMLLNSQAYEVGLCPPALFYDLGSWAIRPEEFWPQVGEAGLYTLTHSATHAKYGGTTVGQYAKFLMEEKLGREFSYVQAQAWDALLIYVESVKKAGTTDADKVIDEIEKIEFEGTRGTITFGGSEHKGHVFYHSWIDVPMFMCQSTEIGQTFDDSDIIGPLEYSTALLLNEYGEPVTPIE